MTKTEQVVLWIYHNPKHKNSSARVVCETMKVDELVVSIELVTAVRRQLGIETKSMATQVKEFFLSFPFYMEKPDGVVQNRLIDVGIEAGIHAIKEGRTMAERS